jgi:hypothetical protein
LFGLFFYSEIRLVHAKNEEPEHPSAESAVSEELWDRGITDLPPLVSKLALLRTPHVAACSARAEAKILIF